MRLRPIICLFCFLLFTRAEAQWEGQLMIDSLSNELQKTSKDSARIRLLNEISIGLYSISPDSGIAVATQSMILATSIHWKPGIAGAAKSKGLNYKYKADFKTALDYYQQAETIYKELKDTNGFASIYNLKGSVHAALGNSFMALDFFQRAYNHYERIGNKDGMAKSLGYLAYIYRSANEPQKSYDCLKKALALNEATGNLSNMVLNLIETGEYYSENDPVKALHHYERAVRYAQMSGKIESEAAAYSSLGQFYKEQEQDEKAISYLKKSLSYHQQSGRNNDIALAHHQLGVVYQQTGLYQEAIDQYYLAAEIDRRIKNRYDESICLLAIASTYLESVHNKSTQALRTSGDNTFVSNKAIEYIERAMQLDKEIGRIAGLQEGYLLLCDAYELKNDHKRALENFRIYKQLSDSVSEQAHDKQFKEISMQFDYAKKQIADSTYFAQRIELKIEKLNRQKRFTIIGVIGFLLVSSLLFFVWRQSRKIDTALKRSDELLLNILPSEVAEELKANGNARAKNFSEATVLFTDFKDFTQLSEQLTPEQLVAEINECFSAFDQIMQEHGIEKIKTIGDSYMAAGGLPVANQTHAHDAVRAAFAILNYIEKHNQKRISRGLVHFEIRIGIHTGPLVAGIVGLKKFAYDIWGDTVNTASRLESSGQEGKINISEATYQRVNDQFHCTYRGQISAKNKGQINMYFVESEIAGS